MVDRAKPIANLRNVRESMEQYAASSERHSRIARTQSDFYEALSPVGLPGPERHWSNRVLRAVGIFC
jgi:hypothetical protein